MPVNKKERHRTGRIGWLRAAVLGANDGILSTSSRIGSFRAPLFKVGILCLSEAHVAIREISVLAIGVAVSLLKYQMRESYSR